VHHGPGTQSSCSIATRHGSHFLKPRQIAANSRECWVPELPTGAVAAPRPDQPIGTVTRTQCTSSQQCRSLVPGSSCVVHANMRLCVPDDRSACVAVEPLFVVPVAGVYSMFCNQASTIPAAGTLFGPAVTPFLFICSRDHFLLVASLQPNLCDP
jgi:hypothetical protein